MTSIINEHLPRQPCTSCNFGEEEFMKENVLKWAGPLLMFILVVGMGYQLLVLTGGVSSARTWGGRLTTDTSRNIGIIVSLGIQAGIFILLLMRMGKWKTGMSTPTITRWMYVISVIFFLNTWGNMMANNALEQAIGTPLTGMAAILFWLLAKNPQSGKGK